MIENLDIKRVYSSNVDDLLNDFYNPVLENATQYDRITGYFSPAIFCVCAKSFAKMITNKGKIRLITSIEVDQSTYEALKMSNSLSDDLINQYRIPDEPLELQTELEKNYYELFVALLKNGTIQLKIALTTNGTGILHEKIGIIKDKDGFELSFSGSNNETVYGWTQNIENFKVFPSWEQSSQSYFANDKSKFEEYWHNNAKNIKILSVDDALKQKIFSSYNNQDTDINKILKLIKTNESLSFYEHKPVSRELRDYQKDAIKHWTDQEYVSIFEMATGSGKTFTSLSALKSFKDKNGYLRCIVVVPLVTLVEQWQAEITEVIDFASIINATGANPGWKSDLRKLSQSAKLGTDEDFIIITTYSTFGSQIFRDLIDTYPSNDLILLADEMHNLVTENNINTALSNRFKYKLGLSATPTRLWKQDESAIVRKLFGGASFIYSLSDAIASKALVGYEYNINPIHLTVEEFEEYLYLSKEVSRLSHFTKTNTSGSNPLATLLTKRAVIKKQAENKFGSLGQLIERLKKNGNFHNTLIYVDSNSSLQNIQKILTDKHIKSSKFTGAESLEIRNTVIKSLESRAIEAIIAIKCLDEGVDIPSATIGIFLSNNTDPREYVQRLGRVLRRNDAGNKTIAHIYDFIVIPPTSVDQTSSVARNLVKSEVIRAKFFEELALNKSDVKESINQILDNYGYYFETDELTGYNKTENEYNE